MLSSDQASRPLLIVVSAPSGAGKTTLCDRLLSELDHLVYSVSCTTREPRGTEVNGRDYYFLTPEEFQVRVEEGRFLEHAVVYGHRYGTLKETVSDALESGQSVLMDIDIQGAAQIRANMAAAPSWDPLKKGFVDIFILPPSVGALKERLERRNEDEPGAIAGRLGAARRELKGAREYKYSVVNDDVERAYAELVGIIEREHAVRKD